jgi:hypothetical protein
MDTKYITIDDLFKENIVVLKKITSKYESQCGRCERPIKIGDKIRWSKITGGLCFPNCLTTYENDLLPDTKFKRKFDFGDE